MIRLAGCLLRERDKVNVVLRGSPACLFVGGARVHAALGAGRPPMLVRCEACGVSEACAVRCVLCDSGSARLVWCLWREALQDCVSLSGLLSKARLRPVIL